MRASQTHSAWCPGGARGPQPKSIPKQDLCCWVGKSACRKLVFRSQLLHSHIPHERSRILRTTASSCAKLAASLCHPKEQPGAADGGDHPAVSGARVPAPAPTRIHRFGACQGRQPGREQHVREDRAAGWSHVKTNAVLRSLSISTSRNQAKSTTAVAVKTP